MSLLVSWIGIDDHGPTSMYIASDSRISWPSNICYDHGRKVFASRISADIFGYCGDVLFPSMVLSQIIEMIDAGLLFSRDATAEEKSKAVKQKLIYQFNNYPSHVSSIVSNSVVILHSSRHNPSKTFDCKKYIWRRTTNKWTTENVPIPSKSDVLFVDGSGKIDFYKRYSQYQKSNNSFTSRNVFHCICDSVENTKDKQVGGAPQLVGIIRKPDSNGVNYGIIKSQKRYYLGSCINELTNFDRIEWRNERFELCNGITCKKMPNAQHQPNPLVQ